MKERKIWTINQMNIFMSCLHGIVFTLSFLFLFEIPKTIIEGDLFVRLMMIFILIPLLIFINYIGFKDLKGMWIKYSKSDKRY